MTVGDSQPNAGQTAAGRRNTPAEADLLCAFANTLDVEDDIDELREPADLVRWLSSRELVDASLQATAADLELALTLRAGIREAMAQHHDGAGGREVAELDQALQLLPLRVSFEDGNPRLLPACDGFRAGLAQLAVAIVSAQTAGVWQRLKLCRASDCQWAFVDTSKNRSRHWCSMGVCGNRQKTRAYRARKRAQA
ncbi:MAG TPA: CGNR zinc finger domain-containing protein [Actinopolymorphaceae bacterium]|jgi:predicted RNA-binding Zn ribbon-like protein